MAVVVGNQKLTSLILLCIIAAAAVNPPWAEAQIPCNGIITALLPCAGYVRNGGAVSPACCEGMQGIVNRLKTKPDRQSACECMKGTVSMLTPEQQKRVADLPGLCKVAVPFKISPDVDCSKVNLKL